MLVLFNSYFTYRSLFFIEHFCYNTMVYFIIIIIIIKVFCLRADPSLQTQEPRPQFYSKAGLPPQTQEPRLRFY